MIYILCTLGYLIAGVLVIWLGNKLSGNDIRPAKGSDEEDFERAMLGVGVVLWPLIAACALIAGLIYYLGVLTLPRR